MPACGIDCDCCGGGGDGGRRDGGGERADRQSGGSLSFGAVPMNRVRPSV